MSLNFENVGKEVIYNRSVDNIEDYVKGTIVGCYIGQDEEYYVTSIESSGECIKVYDDSLIEIIEGDSITPQGIVDATSQMTTQQAADTLGNIGGDASTSPADIVAATGQMTPAQTDRMRANIVAAQDALRLTATPTSGPDETTLMSGTWSGATWEQVVTAILATRLIQVDVATIGSVTLLYNMGSATNASSNAFVYNVGGVLYNVFVELFFSNGNNVFYLTIINALAQTQNVSGTTPTITPAANNIYNCGELTSLTITNPPATGAYSIVFTSGATATTTTIPATILGLESFAAEANTIYEINVLDNRAVVGSWAVSA